MYITITDDENKYYRTWTSGETKLKGCKCIQLDILPPVEEDKKKFCKLKESKEITYQEINQPKLDEEGNEQFEDMIDDDGNVIGQQIIMETVQIPHKKKVYSWQFDEEVYNNHLNELNNIQSEPTTEERLASIEEMMIMLMDNTN